MDLDRNAVKEWFKAKLPDIEQCLACAHNTVRMATEVVEIRRFAGKDKPPGGVAQLVIPMICTNCGLTLFFDAGMGTAVKGAPRPEIA